MTPRNDPCLFFHYLPPISRNIPRRPDGRNQKVMTGTCRSSTRKGQFLCERRPRRDDGGSTPLSQNHDKTCCLVAEKLQTKALKWPKGRNQSCQSGIHTKPPRHKDLFYPNAIAHQDLFASLASQFMPTLSGRFTKTSSFSPWNARPILPEPIFTQQSIYKRDLSVKVNSSPLWTWVPAIWTPALTPLPQRAIQSTI